MGAGGGRAANARTWGVEVRKAVDIQKNAESRTHHAALDSPKCHSKLRRHPRVPQQFSFFHERRGSSHYLQCQDLSEIVTSHVF